MNYLIVENSIITNIIVADADFAASIGALPYYDGAAIGGIYDPPTLNKANVEIKELKLALADTVEAMSDLLYHADVQKLNGGNTR